MFLVHCHWEVPQNMGQKRSFDQSTTHFGIHFTNTIPDWIEISNPFASGFVDSEGGLSCDVPNQLPTTISSLATVVIRALNFLRPIPASYTFPLFEIKLNSCFLYWPTIPQNYHFASI